MDIRLKVKVKADVDDMETLKKLAEYSPTLDTATGSQGDSSGTTPGG